MANHPIQTNMFAEIQDHSLFQKAEALGLQYLAEAFERNVYPHPQALEDLSVFEEALPQQSGNAHEVLEMLHQYGAPAAVTTVGGRYFGFVTGSMVPASIAAKNLALFWDQNSTMQVISPIAAQLETVVQSWLVDLFGLPPETVAGFVSGTSMANFCGLAAARYRLLQNQGWDLTEQGLFDAPKLRVITGRDAHSTVLKAISLIGLGKGNIEWVDVDDQGRIIADQIPPLDNRTLLILQAGNVNSGSFDDFQSICRRAQEQGAWIHIDGAFGLWAQATRQLKGLTEGIAYAHSWAVDGHKTLNTPYDSGIILCKDQEALVASLHMTGGYIVVGEGRDGMYFTPEMSRRARIIELWAAMRYLGREGIDQLVYGLHQRAQQFAKLLHQAIGFEILNDVVFNQVIVQCETDELTEAVTAQIQELRECWVGGSTWKGRKVIRISVCSWATTEEDVKRSVASFQQALEMVLENIAASS